MLRLDFLVCYSAIIESGSRTLVNLVLKFGTQAPRSEQFSNLIQKLTSTVLVIGRSIVYGACSLTFVYGASLGGDHITYVLS